MKLLLLIPFCRTHALTPMYLETDHVLVSAYSPSFSMRSAIILLKLAYAGDKGSSLS